MELIKTNTNFDFIRLSKYTLPIALGVTLLSIALMIFVGFDAGIDFKGGTKIILEFNDDDRVNRATIKETVDELLEQKLQLVGTQIEIQDFDVGSAAAEETVKFQIFSELSSLLSPIDKLELAKSLEKHFGAGTLAEIPFNAGDKFYLTLPADWPVKAAYAEVKSVFAKKNLEVSVVSDKEQTITTDMIRETDLLLSAQDDQVKAEADKVRQEAEAKIKLLKDDRFTIEVQVVKDSIAAAMKDKFGDAFKGVLSTASVSASVGKELFQSAMVAMLYALIGILLYMSLRFEARFGPGAVLGLAHTVFILFAAIIIFDIKFTLPIVAAILTVIGYAINDTIIVYDRIRENMQKGITSDMATLINKSMNETLSRTIVTAITTMLAVTSIWLFGGGTISDFAFLFIVGILAGTYSSLFVAIPLTLKFDVWAKRRRRRARA
ncbi:MAG TPA: protein translocase subunit SecF [Oligoflexales bacterium]|nr:protein translocase subunit SecF [Oligoflexales bacterium]